MLNRNYKLLTAPGLPSWPKLYVDRDSKRACVIARHATWRSYQCAMRLANIFSLAGCAAAAYGVWSVLAGIDTPSRVIFTVILSLFAFPIAKFVVVHGSVGFFARQVFPTKTVVWVSSNAFAFRSRLLLNPVVIWRHWKGQVIRLSFILNRDNDAAVVAYDLKPSQRLLQPKLNEAMILEIVVSASSAEHRMATGDQVLRRTLPMTEVGSRSARKFTTVLAAAVAITSTKATKTKSEEGVDVDG